jgi:hypothetical protein
MDPLISETLPWKGFRLDADSAQITWPADHCTTITGTESPLYINFVVCRTAFDSLHQNPLCQLLRHYRILQRLSNIIKISYDRMTWQVVHQGKLMWWFHIMSGVHQDCLLLPFLFLVAIDWVENPLDPTWWPGFGDDLVLFVHKFYWQTQDKTPTLSTT